MNSLKNISAPWLQIKEHIVHFNAGNRSPFTLCGTNCFLIGSGKLRTLVDPGDFHYNDTLFLQKFEKYLIEKPDVKIQRILVTHGHHDHFGGVWPTIELLKKYERIASNFEVYKWITDNNLEFETYTEYPLLKDYVKTIEHE